MCRGPSQSLGRVPEKSCPRDVQRDDALDFLRPPGQVQGAHNETAWYKLDLLCRSHGLFAKGNHKIDAASTDPHGIALHELHTGSLRTRLLVSKRRLRVFKADAL